MKYDDGFPMDDNLRVTKCPRCENEQFDNDAEYCRICGAPLFNICEGYRQQDSFGNVYDLEYHKNYGNSRFCEKCGKPTEYFRLKFLRPFNEVSEHYIKKYPELIAENNDDSELPF